MIKIDDKINCTGCHSCFNICPVDAISMVVDEEGFKYPKVNTDKCINCDLCVKKCPIIDNPYEKPKDFNNISYSAYSLDKDIRKNGSSGGIFEVFSRYILSIGGYVVGAGFNEEWVVEHMIVNDIKGLNQLTTSKYVQSNIGTTYNSVKKLLDDNKTVYFAGTPCQVAGLLLFLGKTYENLYTQDLVCHGVPSPLIWDDYLNTYFTKSDITKINFRDKQKFGWNNYSLKIETLNKNYIMPFVNNLFLQGFLKDLFLRPSCYSCAYKKQTRPSDITLGDLWGINSLNEKNDNLGNTFLTINSKKGKILFDIIKSSIYYNQIDQGEAIRYNPAYIKTVAPSLQRQNFFEKYHTSGISSLNIFVKKGMKEKLRNKVSLIRSKITK